MKAIKLLITLALICAVEVTANPFLAVAGGSVSSGGTPVDNSVAYDATSETTFTTTSPATYTHTPVGTPKGVLVFLTCLSASDVITGVTYGGVAMTRVPTHGLATCSFGAEVGTAYAYFLGSGIPTGAQTVSVSHTGSADTKHAVAVTVTATADTSIGSSNKLEGDLTTANPSISLDSGSDTQLRFCVLYSGSGTTPVGTIGGSMSRVHNHDYGATVSSVDRETTKSSGSFAIGYTLAADEVAMIAVGIE